uniref:YciI family protein n=1 Tax=Escherichia coli TaxID=562 RepID=UPI002280E5EB|nr:YciI family protein [Escherichia coli]
MEIDDLKDELFVKHDLNLFNFVIRLNQALRDAGRLVVAGPNPAIDSNDPGAAGFTGSTVIAEFASLAEAQAWAQQDPYIAAGVYADVTVKPFKQVF